jgi:hypothetical protein
LKEKKKAQIKIPPVEAEFFHADRRTGRQKDMKLIVAVRNFAKAPKKCKRKRKY